MKISEKQFDYAYKEYAKELLYIAYGYTKNKEDSIDIMQNAYVALLESNKKFESNDHIKSFFNSDNSLSIIFIIPFYNFFDKISCSF